MNRLTRWLKITALIIVAFMAVSVIFGLIPIIALFAWFWNTEPLDEPKPVLDDIDAEYEALIREAR